ncbi:DUF3801 domain-containing protein [Aerococcaceae bacterium NML180378]|nr:DUF3801 domain-containing protein [Aerococcaceae bacterium NML180378]
MQSRIQEEVIAVAVQPFDKMLRGFNQSLVNSLARTLVFVTKQQKEMVAKGVSKLIPEKNKIPLKELAKDYQVMPFEIQEEELKKLGRFLKQYDIKYSVEHNPATDERLLFFAVKDKAIFEHALRQYIVAEVKDKDEINHIFGENRELAKEIRTEFDRLAVMKKEGLKEILNHPLPAKKQKEKEANKDRANEELPNKSKNKELER